MCYVSFIVRGLQQYWNSEMYHINDQTVLEEDYDENYEPTEDGIYYSFLNSCQIEKYCSVINGKYYA